MRGCLLRLPRIFFPVWHPPLYLDQQLQLDPGKGQGNIPSRQTVESWLSDGFVSI